MFLQSVVSPAAAPPAGGDRGSRAGDVGQVCRPPPGGPDHAVAGPRPGRLRPSGGSPRRPSAGAPCSRACRSAWWPGWRGRAAPGRPAGRPRRRGGGWRRCGGGHGGGSGTAARRSRIRRTSRGPSRPPRRFTKTASGGPAMSSRPTLEPGPQGGDGRVVDGDPALLGALAQHRDRAAAQVDVAAVEPAELRDPQAGGVEQLEHGQVAPVERRRRRATSSSVPTSPDREDPGQPAAAGRGPQGAGRVGAEATLPEQPGEVAAQRSRLAGDRGPGELAGAEARPGSGAGAGGRPRPGRRRRCGPSTRRRRATSPT